MRSSQEMLGWPLAAKRFAQNVLPEPDIPTRAIRKTGDDWLIMGSKQYDIACGAHRQVFPAKSLLMDGKIEERFISQGVRGLKSSLVQPQPVVESDGAIVIEPTSRFG